MATKNIEQRMMKLVITTLSGKSIVSSVFEKEAFDLYNQWAKSEMVSNKEEEKKTTKKTDKNDKNEKIIIIEKKKDNKLVEVTAILVSQIAAMQITENSKD